MSLRSSNYRTKGGLGELRIVTACFSAAENTGGGDRLFDGHEREAALYLI